MATGRDDDKRASVRYEDSQTAFDADGPIGRKLKSFYQVIETEPVPDRLLDLLQQLDEAERKAKARR
ncbi:hypothetical protein KYK29_18335 [Shinella daejeonensis]|uniref:NepR family anti-sigma factor n=1 Tax=Shinella daejeonensis TaxID=659017 RepID=UPI0020C76F29|nr:NepR family anti-sigma factor [Shinella daejeonensis]MCP8896889.1 hypothetical protein [Shinella daejeonensis]